MMRERFRKLYWKAFQLMASIVGLELKAATVIHPMTWSTHKGDRE